MLSRLMLSAMTSTTVDGPDSVIWGASACARCSNWARRSSRSCHWACKAVTDWASCGQYSSGCRRRQGLLTQATLQITRATASVMVCQRAGGRTGPLPAWSAGAVVRHQRTGAQHHGQPQQRRAPVHAHVFGHLARIGIGQRAQHGGAVGADW